MSSTFEALVGLTLARRVLEKAVRERIPTDDEITAAALDPRPSSRIECAAALGNLELMKVLRQAGCAWGQACAFAAGHGRLNCLIHAHRKGCGWDVWACTYAAENGHPDCLEYLHRKGCKWKYQDVVYAAMHSHMKQVAMLDSHPRNIPYTITDGQLRCLRYLHGYSRLVPDAATYLATTFGHLRCLTWQHECGRAWDYEDCLREITKYNPNLISYLVFRRSDGEHIQR